MLTALFIVVFVVAALLALALFAEYCIGTAMLCAVVAVVAGVVLIGRLVGLPYERAECSAFERKTGRETELMEWHYFSWDCMVRTDNGWIPLDQVRGTETSS